MTFDVYTYTYKHIYKYDIHELGTDVADSDVVRCQVKRRAVGGQLCNYSAR